MSMAQKYSDPKIFSKGYDQAMSALIAEAFRNTQIDSVVITRTDVPDVIKFEALTKSKRQLTRHNFYWDIANRVRVTKRELETISKSEE